MPQAKGRFDGAMVCRAGVRSGRPGVMCSLGLCAWRQKAPLRLCVAQHSVEPVADEIRSIESLVTIVSAAHSQGTEQRTPFINSATRNCTNLWCCFAWAVHI